MTGKIKRLFLGGPWHEWEVEVPEDKWHYRVPHPITLISLNEPRTLAPVTNYRRLRMGHEPTRTIRSVFVPEYWTDREARHELREYLMRRWIAESPDATR